VAVAAGATLPGGLAGTTAASRSLGRRPFGFISFILFICGFRFHPSNLIEFLASTPVAIVRLAG